MPRRFFKPIVLALITLFLVTGGAAAGFFWWQSQIQEQPRDPALVAYIEDTRQILLLLNQALDSWNKDDQALENITQAEEILATSFVPSQAQEINPTIYRAAQKTREATEAFYEGNFAQAQESADAARKLLDQTRLQIEALVT